MNPFHMLIVGIAIEVCGIIVLLVGGYITGTALNHAKHPTASGVYRKLPFGVYKHVKPTMYLHEFKRGEEYKFISATRKFVQNEDGIFVEFPQPITRSN